MTNISSIPPVQKSGANRLPQLSKAVAFCGLAAAVLLGNATKLVAQTSAVDFGNVSVGITSTTMPLTLTFQTSATIGSIVVMTSGVQGLDFSNAGTGTCITNVAYSAGQTCTVGVSFTPKYAGARYGAAVAYDTTGNAVATGYAFGTGIGPQLNFLSGTEATLSSITVSNPHGIAVDGSGNIYVANDSGLLKETYANGAYTASIISTALYYATSLAVDGAGNLYIADWGNGQVVKEVPTAGGYQQEIIDTNVGYDYGIAVDGSGNVFVSDAEYGRVLKETPTASGYTRSVIVTGLSNAQALAVDGPGNVYVGDQTGIHKEVLSQGAYVQVGSTFGKSSPNDIKVDGAGNVYYSDMVTYNIFKDTPTSNGYVENAVVTDLHAILGPYGLSLDGSGKLYIAYLGGNAVVTSNFKATPALNFAETSVGSTSADSPKTVTVANDGTAPLTVEIPATGQNPSVDSNFTLESGGASDCPVLTAGASSPASIPAATMCQLNISYTPKISGPNTGAVSVTDNDLNAVGPGYATQSVSLNGTTTASTFTISSSPSSLSVLQGNSVSSTITITPQPGFSVNANLSVSGLPSGVTAAFSQNPTSSTTTLTFTASSSAAPGSSTVTITGTAGSDTETAFIDLQVNAAAGYYLTFSASPNTLNVLAGSSGTATLSTTALNGYNSAISLSTCTNYGRICRFFAINNCSSRHGFFCDDSDCRIQRRGRIVRDLPGGGGNRCRAIAELLLEREPDSCPYMADASGNHLRYGIELHAVERNEQCAGYVCVFTRCWNCVECRNAHTQHHIYANGYYEIYNGDKDGFTCRESGYAVHYLASTCCNYVRNTAQFSAVKRNFKCGGDV
ncbi:MAG: choice-of-anchor D domain-containing protein [Acidobacteriota bacterium]|nr:choice-of-anchor D domain-containing protein [Acidobacteriota bacterium]